MRGLSATDDLPAGVDRVLAERHQNIVPAVTVGNVTTPRADTALTGARSAGIFAHGCKVALLAVALVFPQIAFARDLGTVLGAGTPALATRPAVAATPNAANFLGQFASDATRKVADWVIAAGDNHKLPFVIVDKVDATVFVFDAHGLLRGTSPVLLGLARGDDSVPGIGDRKMSSIRPDERTTPAGRFVASLGHDTGNRDILWVDYEDAISLHRVVTSNPKERRLQRLAMASPLDRRISYGCINVPAPFYDAIILPSFIGTKGIVYILPETRSLHAVFAGFSD